MAKLRNTKVEIMILYARTSDLITSRDSDIPQLHTYAHTRHICPDPIQKRHHVSPLGHGTLETGIEGIAGEEGEEVRLTGEAGVGTVVVDEGLETSNTTDWFCGPGSEVVSVWTCIREQKGGIAYSTW